MAQSVTKNVWYDRYQEHVRSDLNLELHDQLEEGKEVQPLSFCSTDGLFWVYRVSTM
jgi:hypothetical protein